MNLTPQQQKNLGVFLSRGHVKWEEVEAALEIKIALGQSSLKMGPPTDVKVKELKDG